MARLDGNLSFVDSCSLMQHYGCILHKIIGPVENIKITTPIDFYLFKTLVELNERKQLLGI